MEKNNKILILILIFTSSFLFSMGSCKKDIIKQDIKKNDTTLRPIYYWVGKGIHKMETATSNLVAGWTVSYADGLNRSIEAQRGWIEVGTTDNVATTIIEMKNYYGQGARKISTDLENWTTSFTLPEAVNYVKTIASLPGLQILQWNSWMTWDSRAIPLLENQPGLILCEMIYPTTLGATDYASCYDKIVEYVQGYSVGHKPAIGLSIYTNIAMDTCVSWALMAAQIDAAKAAGNAFGSALHPIGIFWADLEPTDFTIDDVNNYIIYGTRTPQRVN